MEVYIFYFFALTTLFAGLGVFLHPNSFMAGLHLLATLLGVGGLFLTLKAPFLALIHIFIYMGVLAVLYIYSLTSVNKDDDSEMFPVGKIPNALKVLFGGMFAGIILSSIIFKSQQLGYMVAEEESAQYELENISKAIYIDNIFSFEVISLLILVSMIGISIIIKRSGKSYA